MPVTDVAVVIVGPGVIRSVRDGYQNNALSEELAEAMLGGLDDDYVLVSDGPVPVGTLWREVLASLTGGPVGLAVLVCPSWWSARRTAVVVEAARSVAADVVVRPRSLALAGAAVGGAGLVVEIAQHLVAVVRPGIEPDGRPVRVVSRDDSAPDTTAEEVAESVVEAIASLHRGWQPVVLDGADGVTGAAELTTKVAERLSGIPVITLGDDRLLHAVAGEYRRRADATADAPIARGRRASGPAVATGVSAAAVLAVAAILRGSPPVPPPSTALLSEGRVAVTVPATWSAYRVTAGPGSARLQVSPRSNPEAALHITQAAVPVDQTLAETAETLRTALDEQPPGVFVDFNPADQLGGRSVVTYREIRTEHDVRWAVLLDGGIRIGIGCQSPRGREDLVRHPCEQAIASARESTGTIRAEGQSNFIAPATAPAT